MVEPLGDSCDGGGAHAGSSSNFAVGDPLVNELGHFKAFRKLLQLTQSTQVTKTSPTLFHGFKFKDTLVQRIQTSIVKVSLLLHETILV